MTPGSNHQGGALSKGLRILQVFDERSPALSVAEISRRTQISRASVYRLTGILEDLGYLRRTNRLYRPSNKVLSLGVAAVESRQFVECIRPYLDEIAHCSQRRRQSTMDCWKGRKSSLPCHRDDIITINLRAGSRFPPI